MGVREGPNSRSVYADRGRRVSARVVTRRDGRHIMMRRMKRYRRTFGFLGVKIEEKRTENKPAAFLKAFSTSKYVDFGNIELNLYLGVD